MIIANRMDCMDIQKLIVETSHARIFDRRSEIAFEEEQTYQGTHAAGSTMIARLYDLRCARPG